MRGQGLVGVAAALLVLAPHTAAGQGVAEKLSALGPRPVGSAAHQAAVDLLTAELRHAGLEAVEIHTAEWPLALADRRVLSTEVPPDSGTPPVETGKTLTLFNLTGVLPGRGEGEILLSAHFDTVPRSPGAGDDASGCGAVVGAIADLRRTPLRRSVRVVLFDGEEAGLLGSKAWLEGLSPTERDRILAVVNVEGVGWAGGAGPAVHSFPVRRLGERRLAPGWLVHATLRGGAAAGFPLSAVDPWISLPAQLLVRSNGVRFGADSDSFLAAGVPALFVSDGSFVTFDPAYHRPADTADRLDDARLERWSGAIASIVRRLDGLEGRPVDEDQYLVALGRVWLRRDLLWFCFTAWALLAVTSWRRRAGAEAGPAAAGFAFRTLLIVASFVVPVFAATLLVPAALLALRPARSARGRRWVVALGLAPAAGLLALAAFATRRGFLTGWELGLPASLLLGATLTAFALSTLRPAPELPA
jgi:hypothetical protein